MSDQISGKNLALTTFILRGSIVLFLAPWVITKFTNLGQTKAIFAGYYHIKAMPDAGAYAVAVLWAVLLLAFAVGFKKRISYGLVMLFHGLGTLMTVPALLPFLDGYNQLFLAAIPALAAMIALYRLREHDTLFALKG